MSGITESTARRGIKDKEKIMIAHEERLKRKVYIETWLKETFPTMAHEVASAEDFQTGRFLFKIGGARTEDEVAGFYLEINPATIDHVIAALAVRSKNE